jgi:hypothetical protein
MTSNALAETISDIARRERTLAIVDGDYLRAIAIALLESRVRRFLGDDLQRGT